MTPQLNSRFDYFYLHNFNNRYTINSPCLFKNLLYCITMYYTFLFNNQTMSCNQPVTYIVPSYLLALYRFYDFRNL